MKTRLTLFGSGIILLLLVCNGPIANSQSFVKAVERAKPAVVTIRTYNAYGEFNTRVKKSGGSGIIIDKNKGYVLTNYHVVADEEADGILVSLPDGRSFVGVTMVGYDRLSDLAVLEIDPKDAKNLPEIEWSDSKNVQIGDWALAIGYPHLFTIEGGKQDAISWWISGNSGEVEHLFGLSVEILQPTVSIGIVSATDKIMLGEISGEEYLHTSLIQTDAAINPGNSGGALVNEKGQLIGINTWIQSEGGGSDGVGFAISANTAKKICKQLINSGYVDLINFGLETQSVTSTLKAKEKLELPSTSGVYVSAVEDDSPSFTAGIKPGDVIRSLSEQPIKNERHFKAVVRLLPFDQKVNCGIIRDGVHEKVTLYPERIHTIVSGMGLTVTQLNRKNAENYTRRGVIVTDIERFSIFEAHGLRQGDLIYQINHRKIHSLEDFNIFSDMLPSGRTIPMRYHIERRIEQNSWHRFIDFNVTK